MMNQYPRVALFTDCFVEVNGVSRTCQELVGYVGRRKMPFLSAHCGDEECFKDEGTVRTLQMRRSPNSVSLEQDLGFDPFLWRYLGRVTREVRNFEPDLIHVTSPGDVGQMGAYLAYRYKIPLVAAWHTNLHEYAEQRLERRLTSLPLVVRNRLVPLSNHLSLGILRWFYRFARLILAPTEELAQWLGDSFGRPARVMKRGVDTERFHPSRRDRDGGPLRLGFVGRLSPEKNLHFLAELESFLREAGREDYEFVIVGDGQERPWLESHMKRVVCPGVLRGEALARAYANMDLFVFPSNTDTFGNAVQEALSSGVPAVVTSKGGPKHIVRSGKTGIVASNDREFMRAVLSLMSMKDLRKVMSEAARSYACSASWDRVFDGLFQDYAVACQEPVELPAAS